MGSVTNLSRLFPCLLLLVVIVIFHYYISVTDGNLTTYVRRKLPAILVPFQFPNGAAQKNATFPLHILLLSYARTGSSFVGDLLQSYPKAFYHFEPLHFLSNAYIKSLNPEAGQLLHKLFQCRVTQLPGFLSWQRRHKGFIKLKRNHRFWKACTRTNSCYNATYMDKYCSNHSIVVVKTIRLGLKDAAQLFAEFPDLNLKIVYLARDPRGTMNSRAQNVVKSWCRDDPMCFNSKQFCTNLEEDSFVACELLATRPNDFVILRYEDLSKDPVAVTKRLAKILGIPDTKDMEEFLKSHTAAAKSPRKLIDGVEYPYSTFRNSVMTATKWRQELSFAKAMRIQRDCATILTWLGYHTYTTSGALRSNLNFDKKLRDSIISYCPQEINVN